MSLPHAIMTALLEDDQTGYELAKQFDVSLGFFWQASHQQIYRELKRLHTQALVSVREVPQSGKPDKRVYTLTQSGHETLTDWVQESTRPRTLRDELYIKLYNMGSVPTASLRNDIHDRRQQHEVRLTLYRKIEARNYHQPEQLSARGKGIYLSLRAGILQEETALQWCDEALGLLTIDPDTD